MNPDLLPRNSGIRESWQEIQESGKETQDIPASQTLGIHSTFGSFQVSPPAYCGKITPLPQTITLEKN